MKKISVRLFISVFIFVLCIGPVNSNASTDGCYNVYKDLSTGQITIYSDEESSTIVPQLLANTHFDSEEILVAEQEFSQNIFDNSASVLSTTPTTISGSAQANSPFSKICHIKMEYANGQYGYATGFFVGPNAVATAAHIAKEIGNRW